uniref:Uncharacterized protein n=1 Tax=Panagrolaimus sp. PS1159 TaxID=55785 RepID=A0AC35FV00_9BILA
MEFFSLLQSQINDLRNENEQLRTQLKTADERLIEIEKRLKINRKEIPSDAKFEIARLTLSKIGTFQFFGGSKTVDVASFLRQVAPDEQTIFNSKLPRQLFTDCINMILGDSVIYYSYKKNPKEGCCQLDPNLFNCILGLICDGYGLSKDPLKDNEKDKYLRECIMEELNITARKVFKNAADPQKSKHVSHSSTIIEPPSSTSQSRPQSNDTVSVKAETEPDPPVYCIESDEEDSDY